MLCTERRVDPRGSSFSVRRRNVSQPGVMKQGKVEGKFVADILLDTGCSRTVVHQDLVPRAKIQEGAL